MAAENKTKPTMLDARAFVDRLADEQRRIDCHDLIVMMQKITGHPPKMWGAGIVGFDRYHYRYASGREGDMMLTGFAPRKQELVLYLGPGLDNQGLMTKLGKHKAGKGCLYV
jgi:hypothetical protein